MMDRDYSRGYGGLAAMEAPLLLSRVCFLTIFAVLLTAGGAALTWTVDAGLWRLVGFVGSLVMLFVCRAVAHKFPLNIAALAVFALMEGALIGPIVSMYAKLNGPMIVVQAAMLSVAIFAMVGTLGYTSARSYANWVPWLTGALFLLIIASIILWFVTSAMANWIFSVAGAVLFTAFIFVDFTRIRHNYSAEDYIQATIEVYLDLINLFLFVLRLIGGRRS